MEATLELEFQCHDGATTFRCVRQEPPWKVVRGFTLKSGASLVHLNNVSGGILGGDSLKLSAHVACDAQAQITTTGATRVYRPRPESADAALVSEFSLDRNASLEYLPDTLIPFRQSRVFQRTFYSLAEGAALFAWDTIAPGRCAAGEIFEYERLKIVSEIKVSGKPILNDRVLLEPHNWKFQSPAIFGSSRYFVTFFAIRAGSLESELSTLEQALQSVLDRTTSEAQTKDYWGATTLPAHGLMVRGMTASPVGIPGILFELWSIAKQHLCGNQAEAPRKTY
jgi:urease accessory protein